MKYFEMQEPYYALIVAETEEKAKEVYKEIVCDIDDDEEEAFYAGMKEVEKQYARHLFRTTKDEDGKYPSLKEFIDMKNDLLLIDASLI